MHYFIFIYVETHLATLCKDLMKFLATGVAPESPASFTNLGFLLVARFPIRQLGPKEPPLAGGTKRCAGLPGLGQRELSLVLAFPAVHGVTETAAEKMGDANQTFVCRVTVLVFLHRSCSAAV